jgi:hypothetical protein
MKKFVKFFKGKLTKIKGQFVGNLIKRYKTEDNFNVIKVDDVLKNNGKICFNKLENN